MFFFFEPEKLPLFTTELERFERVLSIVRAVHPQMTTATLVTLIGLARRQEMLWSRQLTLPEFADEMGMAYTSLLRNLDLLSEGSSKTSGLGLIEKGIDAVNQKERRLRITQDGLSLLNRIEILLGADPTEVGRHVLIYPAARDSKK